MKKERYAFFLDIDGTLYTNGTVCKENREAIKQARQLGHLVFINTARSLAIIPPEVLSVGADGLITSLGCSITVGGEKLLHETIPPEELAQLVDHFNAKGQKIIFEGEYLLFGNPFYGEGDAIVKSTGDYLENFYNEPVSKVYIPHVLTPAEQKDLGQKYVLFQHPGYAEFAVKGHSKSTGIDFVLKKYGIPRERSVAMGDSLNDEDMLRFCGISVAMGDGYPKIREMCSMVTCPAAEGGVAMGIKNVLGI